TSEPISMGFDSNHPGLLLWNVPVSQPATDRIDVTIAVSDGKGHTTPQTFTLTVVPDATDRQPSIVSSYRTTVQLGPIYGSHVVGSAADGDPLRYVLESPMVDDGKSLTNLNLDPATGLLTWVPTEAEFGINHIVLHVEAGRGASSPPQDCVIQLV